MLFSHMLVYNRLYYALNAILQIFHTDNIIVILEKQNIINIIIALMIYIMIVKIINIKSFKVENLFLCFMNIIYVLVIHIKNKCNKCIF